MGEDQTPAVTESLVTTPGQRTLRARYGRILLKCDRAVLWRPADYLAFEDYGGLPSVWR